MWDKCVSIMYIHNTEGCTCQRSKIIVLGGILRTRFFFFGQNETDLGEKLDFCAKVKFHHFVEPLAQLICCQSQITAVSKVFFSSIIILAFKKNSKPTTHINFTTDLLIQPKSFQGKSLVKSRKNLDLSHVSKQCQ